MEPIVTVEKLNHDANMPTKPKSDLDAGWDVYPNFSGTIAPHSDALIGTGLRVAIPAGYCLQVNPRSGKAVKNKLVIGARVIDAPYRGELKIHVFNHSDVAFEFTKHDPIAQLLILGIAGTMVEGKVDMNTERGTDGFGSTDGTLRRKSWDKVQTASANVDCLDVIDRSSLIEKLTDIRNMRAHERLTVSDAEFLLGLLNGEK